MSNSRPSEQKPAEILSLEKLIANFDALYDKEYKKYAKPGQHDNLIPAERAAQLKLIENLIVSFDTLTKFRDKEKALVLTGALLWLEKMIYDSYSLSNKYWYASRVTNSEVYNNIRPTIGETEKQKLDAETQKNALFAFRNYYLTAFPEYELKKQKESNEMVELDKVTLNPLLQNVDAKYQQRFAKSITELFPAPVAKAALESAQLNPILPKKKTTLEAIANWTKPEAMTDSSVVDNDPMEIRIKAVTSKKIAKERRWALDTHGESIKGLRVEYQGGRVVELIEDKGKTFWSDHVNNVRKHFNLFQDTKSAITSFDKSQLKQPNVETTVTVEDAPKPGSKP